MRVVLTVFLAGALGTPARSQVDFARLDTEIRYSIDEEGRILIAPDPASGGATDAFTALVRERLDQVLANAGAVGLASCLFCGDTDVASLADGAAFFARLGRDDDAALLQCIAGDDERRRHTLLERMLAVRVAQDRGFKPAIGVLERLLARQDLDPHFARAVEEALASLRGHRHDDPPTLPPLTEVLAAAPADADAHLRIDQFRLPCARPLLRNAGPIGLEVTKQMILQAGGRVSVATWAGARMLADGPALLPYEVARRFGNARVHRVVIAAKLPEKESDRPRIWAHLDGIFDVAALRAGLTAAHLEVGGDATRLHCAIFDGLHLTATSATVRIHSTGFEGERDHEAAAALTRTIESDDAPIVAVLDASAVLPDPIVRLGRPERLAVWLPRQADQAVRAHLRCSDDRLPDLIAGEVGGFRRLLERWVDEDERLDILEKACARMHIEAADRSCSLTVSLQGIDLGELLLAVARSGKLH